MTRALDVRSTWNRAAFALILIVACALSAQVQGFEPVQERIEILSGDKCAVRGRKLECAAVATYLRNQLKLEKGHMIRVSAGRSVNVTYTQLHALFDSLKEAGFATYRG